MKKFSRLAAAAALFGILLFASCAKEDEPQPIDNGGQTGDPRAKFHGNWSNSENSQDFGPATYNVTIADSSNASYMLISYLYGFTSKTYATVSGNSFTIPAQVIQANSVSGYGTLANTNTINMTYFVQTSASHYDTITAVLTK